MCEHTFSLTVLGVSLQIIIIFYYPISDTLFGNGIIIKGLDNIAIAYYNLGDTDSAVKACQEALLKCEELKYNDYNIEVLEYWNRKIQHDMGIMLSE